ncbi:flagellar motor switch phosphatase FliY [Acetonema longum]|uniref:Flagellar motor switch protein n=1 Tax=Acetonema longum DSM 6540 TaxID=1009370 RepID=F7NL54_9FIRM|nr:flagellar motor switch phosphatase FliY [Acetonema longum]EGO63159.1 flagellar motor switch protein [Acetonema longum DSM 6540]
MTDGFLSQDEIDALLRGEPGASSTASAATELTDVERDALGEVGNICMGSAATTLSVLLSRRVSITTPKVSITTINEIKNQYPLPYLVIEVGYTDGIIGSNLLAMRESDALVIADLMMGKDGTNPPEQLNELYMSAVTEAMNQMMGSTATSMSTVFKKKVDISPPAVNLYDFAVEPAITESISGDEAVVRVNFRMEVEDLIDSEIMQIVTMRVAREMVNGLMGSVKPDPAAMPKPQPAAPVAGASKSAPAEPERPVQSQPQAAAAMPKVQPVQNVQPVQFVPLKPAALAVSDANLGLIMDVPMQITVELGRTRKQVREILEMAPGSVVELDKLAGEPVDVLVNGKLIAKGEVVVIDENFGVRITDIVGHIDRLNNLQ